MAIRFARLAVPVLLGAGLIALSGRTEGDQSEELALVPLRPELTRVVLRSTLPLVVDVYWLRLINAVSTIRTESEYRNLKEYGRVLTTLDPDFRQVYWLLGLTMPYNRGREEWVNGEEAIELLQRGIARFPEDLQLRLLLGYSLMTFTDRYAEAGQAFVQASQLPGAPRFAALLATRLLLKGDQYEAALSLALSMRDGATSEEERARFEHRVNELLDEAVLRRLDEAGAAFHQKHGRYPAGLAELVHEGFAPPEDPRFGHVRFDHLGRALLPESHGRVKVFHDSFGGRDDDAPETWR